MPSQESITNTSVADSALAHTYGKQLRAITDLHNFIHHKMVDKFKKHTQKLN